MDASLLLTLTSLGVTELSFKFEKIRHQATQEIQLQEVRLYGRSGQRLIPTSCTNPNGLNPVRQGPLNVMEDSRFKWLDQNFHQNGGAVLSLQFDQPVDHELSAYEFVTANDNPMRDPTSWKLYARSGSQPLSGGSPDASSASWTMLDARDAMEPPRERLSTFGRFWLKSSSPAPALVQNDKELSNTPPPTLAQSRVADLKKRLGSIPQPAPLSSDALRVGQNSSTCTAGGPTSHNMRCDSNCGQLMAKWSEGRRPICHSCRCGACAFCENAVCNLRSTRCTRGPCGSRSANASAVAQPRVLVLGDSLFSPSIKSDRLGAVAEGIPPQSRGCAMMSSTLSSREALDIETRAVAGAKMEKIVQLYPRSAGWTHVVVAGGINDIPLDATADFDVSGIVGSMAKLVRSMLGRGVKRVVLVGYPEGEGFAPGKPRHNATVELRRKYKQLAARNPMNVTFVDGSRLFGPYPQDAHLFGADRSHPSAAGGVQLGAAIGRALRRDGAI